MRKLLQTANSRVTASMLVMGMGQLLYKQWGKGLMFLAVQLGYMCLPFVGWCHALCISVLAG